MLLAECFPHASLSPAVDRRTARTQLSAGSGGTPSSAGRGEDGAPLSAAHSSRSRLTASAMALAAASHAVLTPGGPLPQPVFSSWRDGSTSRRGGGGGGVGGTGGGGAGGGGGGGGGGEVRAVLVSGMHARRR